MVTLDLNNIQTERLTFRTQDTDFLLSGLMENFAKPTLDIKASSSKIELQKFLTLYPALQKKIKVNITGQADIEATYKGPAHKPSSATITATAKISGTTIAHEKLLSDITDISGQLDYKNDHLAWSGLNANFKDKLYILNGQMANFSRPVIDTKIISDDINLTTQIKILRQAFQLTLLTGDYLNTNFDLKGDVHLFEDAAADIDLRGKVVLNLKDIGHFIPRFKNKAEQLKPTGIITGEGIFRGKLNNWREWKVSLNAVSDEIIVLNYPFQDVSINFEQRDMHVSKFNILSTVFGGGLKVNSSVDLRDDQSLFTSIISLENLDLKQLRKDRNLENRYLAGNLTMMANLQGIFEKWRQLTGEGSLNITEGSLWQWNALKGISGIFLIPEFKNMVFTEAEGNFKIHDQKFHTDNARMTSKTTTLNGKGWIDFNQNLNFNITPNFSKISIFQSDSLKKGPTSILTQTNGYLNIKLTGTLGNPKINVEKFPIKIIEETIGGTAGTLKEVIGNIIDEIF